MGKTLPHRLYHQEDHSFIESVPTLDMAAKATIFQPKMLGGFAQCGPRWHKKRQWLLKPPLTIEQILAWADAHYERTGMWPNAESGRVYETPSLTWKAVALAIRSGGRGLGQSGGSLAKLLAEKRGVRNHRALPRLTIKQMLAWADAHHGRTGNWPNENSGRVYDAPSEAWGAVNAALRVGVRGLAGGNSLVRLLAERRGARNRNALPRLTIKQILVWVDAYYKQTGRWPTAKSGVIEGSPNETWSRITSALLYGRRGLPAGSSVPKLLAKYRNVRNRMALASLSIEQILRWADAEYRRTGRWPTTRSGSVVDAPGETWYNTNSALYKGGRGLPVGLSLRRLLIKYRGVRKKQTLRHVTLPIRPR